VRFFVASLAAMVDRPRKNNTDGSTKDVLQECARNLINVAQRLQESSMSSVMGTTREQGSVVQTPQAEDKSQIYGRSLGEQGK